MEKRHNYGVTISHKVEELKYKSSNHLAWGSIDLCTLV